MAIATGKARCATCGKERSSYKCGGCSKEFCFNHLADHKQELSKQFDEIEVNRDLFRQTLTEQTSNPQRHTLIQQIDRWERDSIKKIQRTAEETRQLAFESTTKQITELETKLNKLTNELRQSREENDFNETDLRHFQEELVRLTKALAHPANVSIQQDSTPLIVGISTDVTSGSDRSIAILSRSTNIEVNTKWVPNGITVAGGNEGGKGLNQLLSPLGIYVHDDQTVYVADWFNSRIVEWKSGATSGRVVAGGNGANQLDKPTHVIVDNKSDSFIICDQGNNRIVRWPRRNGTSGQTIISDVDCWTLALDNDGCLYVSDQSKHEVTRWRIGDNIGTVVAGGNGQGDRLDQFNFPSCIFVDQDYSVYVSDSNNHRVMKWTKGAKEGIVVAGGHGRGDDLMQLSHPAGMVVDQLGTIYVADQCNSRVVRWTKGTAQGSIIIGGNGNREQQNQLHCPVGLSFDKQGNLYVVDMNNHRVQKFNINSA